MKQWLVLATLVGTAQYFGFVSFNAVLGTVIMTAFLLVMGLARLEGLQREFALAKAKV